MFALLAFLDFVIALILKATSTSTGDVDMLLLGLALLSLHFVWPVVVLPARYRKDVP